MSGQVDESSDRASAMEVKKQGDSLHVESQKGLRMTEDEAFVENYPEKDRKKLILKMDLHILPTLVLLYCKLRFFRLFAID